MGDERRKNSRIPTEQVVSFTAFAEKSRLGQARDISLSGIRFEASGLKLVPGDLLQVSFQVSGETIEAVGRVVRTKTVDSVTTEVALHFVRIDPWAARLIEREFGDGE